MGRGSNSGAEVPLAGSARQRDNSAIGAEGLDRKTTTGSRARVSMRCDGPCAYVVINAWARMGLYGPVRACTGSHGAAWARMGSYGLARARTTGLVRRTESFVHTGIFVPLGPACNALQSAPHQSRLPLAVTRKAGLYCHSHCMWPPCAAGGLPKHMELQELRTRVLDSKRKGLVIPSLLGLNIAPSNQARLEGRH